MGLAVLLSRPELFVITEQQLRSTANRLASLLSTNDVTFVSRKEQVLLVLKVADTTPARNAWEASVVCSTSCTYTHTLLAGTAGTYKTRLSAEFR